MQDDASIEGDKSVETVESDERTIWSTLMKGCGGG
jgi:hypothetical protein